VSVRHALLALLSEGPKYGLQLREEFEAGTGEVWPLNVGQVYTTLQRLERDGLAESDRAESGRAESDRADSEGPQRRFRITAAGQQELAGWLRTPPDMTSPPRDELVMKILVALRVPGTDVPGVIQAHRRYLVQLMQQWTRIKESLVAESDLGLDPSTLASTLAVDAELFRLDSVIRWLDAADGRIKRAVPAGQKAAPQEAGPVVKLRTRSGVTR
jgi:DNA-binding PadR family transcriptional regulator